MRPPEPAAAGRGDAPSKRAGGPAAWTAADERSNLLALRAMRSIALLAGRPVARLVLHPIAAYFLVANGTARRASRQFLERALGRPAGWREVYRQFHTFAATVLDRVYLLQGRFGEFDVTATGVELVRDPMLRGEGVLVAGAHFGSFEALRALGLEHSMPIAMLMYEENARRINATLAAIAPDAKLRTIGLGRPGAMLELRRWLDDGGLAGLLADRTLPGRSERDRTVRLDFLGQPARFADGPFRLALMLRQRLTFMAGLYHGGRRYELRFVEIADFRPGAPTGGLAPEARIAAALARYVRLLEDLCHEAPHNWFNFFDFWSDDDADLAPPAVAAPASS